GCYDIIIRPLPTQQWSLSLGNAMLEYAQGTGSWSGVESAFVNGWASEYKTTHK
ncbi:MAG: carbohydrate ABC transporter substrate-binding protein, partial [Bifidobacterium sp.]|nr:carbohydrate ABC transporter substrate-binding protein [Bifidobacterium sp.]